MVNIVGPKDNYYDPIDGKRTDLSMIAGTDINKKTTPEEIRAAYSARQAGFERRMREDCNVALEEGNLKLTRKIQDENMLLLMRALERHETYVLEPKRNAARDKNWAEFNASKVTESKEKAKAESRYRAETEATVQAVMENRSPEVKYADWNVDDDVDAPPAALDEFAFANGKGVHEKMFGRKQVLRVDSKGGPRYVPSGLSRGAVHATQQHNKAEAAKFSAAVRDVLAPNPRGNK